MTKLTEHTKKVLKELNKKFYKDTHYMNRSSGITAVGVVMNQVTPIEAEGWFKQALSERDAVIKSMVDEMWQEAKKVEEEKRGSSLIGNYGHDYAKGVLRGITLVGRLLIEGEDK